ncbi:MAG: hypothetical protein DMG57_43905 [Acidobacteria bacterium]|nr:MAG: hypothetical protein DMG57_43905 [Acidobacteriota bacterium]
MAYFKVVTAEQKSRLDQAVWVNQQRMSGTPCFRGTRVPVRSKNSTSMFQECFVYCNQRLSDTPPATLREVTDRS